MEDSFCIKASKEYTLDDINKITNFLSENKEKILYTTLNNYLEKFSCEKFLKDNGKVKVFTSTGKENFFIPDNIKPFINKDNFEIVQVCEGEWSKENLVKRDEALLEKCSYFIFIKPDKFTSSFIQNCRNKNIKHKIIY